MKLNALGKLKFDKIAQDLKSLNESDITLDVDFKYNLVQRIVELFKNGDLPNLTEFTKLKEVEGLSSENINSFVETAISGLLEYQRYMYDIGTNINSLMDKLLEGNIEINKKRSILLTKLKDIESGVINKSNNNSIYDEENIISDFKNDNLFGAGTNVDVSDNGAITLPISEENTISPSDYDYKVEFPVKAISELNISSNPTGLSEANLYIPGYYAGKFFGSFSKRNDIRLSSSLKSIFNNKIDRKWEIEYVTNNVTNQKVRVGVILYFANNVNINSILLNSSNEIDAYYLDSETNEFLFISDYDNEWYQNITTKQIKLVCFGNTPERIVYNLLSIIRNNITTYTYNYLESVYRRRPDIYSDNFRNYDIGPNSSVEDSAEPGDETIVNSYKYRSAVTINSINIFKRIFKTSGSFISNELRVGGSIRTVELFSESYIPNLDFQYIKYEISFDGKEFYNIQSLSESGTEFSSTYHKRIVLGEDGSTPGYLYLADKVYDTIYTRITLATDDINITPVLYQYRLRVKIRN